MTSKGKYVPPHRQCTQQQEQQPLQQQSALRQKSREFDQPQFPRQSSLMRAAAAASQVQLQAQQAQAQSQVQGQIQPASQLLQLPLQLPQLFQQQALPQQPRPQQQQQRPQHRQPQDPLPLHQEGDEQAAGKGVISLLQEFVQCSRQFHAPQHRPILQWSFDNRMADFATLEFRGTVAFLLDGVPHHVAGAWHASKKIAQRDTAERALSFFVTRWGEQLLLDQDGQSSAPQVTRGAPELTILEEFCQTSSIVDKVPPSWSFVTENGEHRAQVELVLLGVSHKFAGGAKATQKEAVVDTCRRVLWYLQCPGFEELYSPDPDCPAVTAKEIPGPPANWASDAAEGCAVQVAERKTALMRVQNRIQQTYARQLRPGQSVWEWRYEVDENDASWPPLCRATVHIPVAERSFTGSWARGQRDAQIEACQIVSTYLDENVGNNLRTRSGSESSTDA